MLQGLMFLARGLHYCLSTSPVRRRENGGFESLKHGDFIVRRIVRLPLGSANGTPCTARTLRSLLRELDVADATDSVPNKRRVCRRARRRFKRTGKLAYEA